MEDEEFVDIEEILSSTDLQLRYLIVNKLEASK
jgi:hypothetical protein